MVPLLEIKNLSIQTNNEAAVQSLIKDISLRLGSGTIMTIIGESGCGKSLVAHAILGILPEDIRVRGTISFHGKHIRADNKKEIRKSWGRKLFFFPQEPGKFLNPLRRSFGQVVGVYRYLWNIPLRQAREKTGHLFERVGLTSSDYRKYPWQLSGGMGQRLLSAITLAEPAQLIIADEPTKGLDQEMKQHTALLLKKLTESGKSLLVITHDLAVADILGGNMAIMYSGTIVERGTTADILKSPRHPYTKALWEALPANGLKPIPQQVHTRENKNGCVFANRCSQAIQVCFQKKPAHIPDNGKQSIACHHCC